MIRFQQNTKATWVGRVLSALVGLPFLMSSFMKLTSNPQVIEGVSKMGVPQTLILPLGILELACLITYWVPFSAVLGALLLTGYLGGAILTHLRVGEAPVLQVVFGIVIWLGVWLREPRLREILPVRRG